MQPPVKRSSIAEIKTCLGADQGGGESNAEDMYSRFPAKKKGGDLEDVFMAGLSR
jgi:hypothetical protein